MLIHALPSKRTVEREPGTSESWHGGVERGSGTLRLSEERSELAEPQEFLQVREDFPK